MVCFPTICLWMNTNAEYKDAFLLYIPFPTAFSISSKGLSFSQTILGNIKPAYACLTGAEVTYRLKNYCNFPTQGAFKFLFDFSLSLGKGS